MMNRRRFVASLGLGALASFFISKGLLHATAKTLPKQFGSWQMADDGTLSLHGQDSFPVYGDDGGLTLDTVSYRWENDAIVEYRNRVPGRKMTQVIIDASEALPLGSGTHVTKRVVWTATNGGTF